MGCVHGKCCGKYPKTLSDDGGRDGRGVGEGRDNGYNHDDHLVVLNERSLETVSVPAHGFSLEYSVITQRGYYPDSPDKENQDSYCIKTGIQGNLNVHFFGVFDGHGQFGTQCANFVKDRLVEILENDPTLIEDPVKAFNTAFITTNVELHDNSEIDDSMSGTTAITVLVIGDTLYVANVGDSRAVIAVKNPLNDVITAEDLSCDQTPFRKDECQRVKDCGARVLSVDQVEGLKDPSVQNWGDEENDGGDPPRLWVQNGMFPGTAFTRSVGDATAEKIGVVAVPEVSTIQLTPNHLFFVIASDGVFEFIFSQAVVNMVLRYSDPRDACAAITGESYRLWLEHENRTDDITMIIVNINGLQHNSGAGIDEESSRFNNKPTLLVMEKLPASVSASTASDVYPSFKSDFSEMKASECDIIIERSPVCLVPSPLHSRPLEA